MKESSLKSQVVCSQLYQTKWSWQQNNVVYENTKPREVWLIMPVLRRCQDWLADKWLNDSPPAGQSDCTKLKLTYLIQGLPQQLSHYRRKHGKLISTTSNLSNLAHASLWFHMISEFKGHYTTHSSCKKMQIFFQISRINVLLVTPFTFLLLFPTRVIVRKLQENVA